VDGWFGHELAHGADRAHDGESITWRNDELKRAYDQALEKRAAAVAAVSSPSPAPAP
jgi:hypothetical protein